MVFARCNPDAVDALLPPPLKAAPGGLVRFSAHHLICDLGFGWPFAQANPARCQFHEASVAIAAEHEGKVGSWCPFIWCDSDAEMAVGREMFGWPQVLGDIALTAPHPQRGWALGDTVCSAVSRHGRSVFDLSLTLEREGDIGISTPPFVTFYTMRVLPNPATGEVVREIFASDMSDVEVGDLWSGAAEITLSAPDLRVLDIETVVGGRCQTVSWTKMGSRPLCRQVASA